VASGASWAALTSAPSVTADLPTRPEIGEVMRANLFVYRDMKDPWLGRLREEPEKTLCDALPGLEKYTGDFEVLDRVKIRPIDLYVSTAHKQPGVVLVGDAYSTSCPAAGTGVTKVLVDVERLCNKYIPEWLASEGMGAEKIAAFYDDPEKVANEAQCLRQAFRLRDQTLQTGAFWRARHWAVSLAHMGVSVVQRA